MNDLVEQIKVAIADSTAFALKARNYHWNVEGPHFYHYHKLFDEIYNEVNDAVDGLAEGLRTLDAYVPASFIRYQDLTTIKDETTVPPATSMISRLKEDNDKVLITLNKAYDLAEKSSKFGISNFIQDRITAHEKWGNFFLRATLKG